MFAKYPPTPRLPIPDVPLHPCSEIARKWRPARVRSQSLGGWLLSGDETVVCRRRHRERSGRRWPDGSRRGNVRKASPDQARARAVGDLGVQQEAAAEAPAVEKRQLGRRHGLVCSCVGMCLLVVGVCVGTAVL